MPADTPWRKKLIEVAIPLDAINRESAREKSIRHGHPSTLHLWWARRPLAACRAVIFCSLIDDPGEAGAPAELLRQIDALPEPLPLPADWDVMDLAEQRRQKLFKFIETLVKWESTTDEDVIGTARELILAATDGNPPPLLDPFCGGGSIPLEAQRLGLEAHGSDLNPVAVLITKALIELPPKFAGMPPVNPDARAELGSDAEWNGAAGLAEDVRWYGEWMRQQAWERIGHLYPQGPNGETVIAWLWARTVECPNPACGAEMPMMQSSWLSKKQGVWVEPRFKDGQTVFRFGQSPQPSHDGTVKRTGVMCSACGNTAPLQYIRSRGQHSELGSRMIGVVTEGDRRRVYREATDHDHDIAAVAPPTGVLDLTIPNSPKISPPHYGMTRFRDLFSARQLTALATFSALVEESRTLISAHATAAGYAPDRVAATVSAISTYLAFAVDRSADRWSAIATWQNSADKVRAVFARQAIPMVWDFAEANPFSNSTGNWADAVGWIVECIEALPTHALAGSASHGDSTNTTSNVVPTAIATDPPYYDNIIYADIADFFYVWLRETVNATWPDLFSTVLTPKTQETVVAPHRFDGDRKRAAQHFESGIERSFAMMRRCADADTPTTVFYAYKQTERRDGEEGGVSTGWEKMLDGLIASGFQITATWPMRTERGGRSNALHTNALASSVVIACRPRPDDAPMANIGEFNRALASELPATLNRFIGEHIAPVDLPQASIGPGMAVFSRYSAVVLPNGERMTVRRALELINEGVEQFFSEREGAFDAPTQFCLRWFEQFGFEDGPFGDADNMARAKDISVEELQSDGLLTARRGRVQLLPFGRYEATWESWDPTTERRLSAWRACHYLAAALEHGGVLGAQHDAGGAARLARDLGGNGEQAKELAYRLYAICDAKGWAQEARRYNALADAWSEISAEAAHLRQAQQGQLGVN